MEEARMKIKDQEIEEKLAKERKEELKVRDYMDITRELTGFVRENYLMSFQLGRIECGSEIIGLQHYVILQISYLNLSTIAATGYSR